MEAQYVTANVSNAQFLSELAKGAPQDAILWVCHFKGEPREDRPGIWAGEPYNPSTTSKNVDGWAHWNTYFSVAALFPDDNGEIKRRKTHMARMLALVADDLPLEDVQDAVSYVIATSPGKHQVGIFLDGQDPDAADKELCDLLLQEMVRRQVIRMDKSGNNAVRYVRLPVGENQKPRDSGHFSHQVVVWAPAVRYCLADAAATFGIDLDSLRSNISRSKKSSAPADSIREPQGDKLRRNASNILSLDSLHDSINEIAASGAASGAHAGFLINLLRGLMDNIPPSQRSPRWQMRYADIPRAVETAIEKFSPQLQPASRMPDAAPYAVVQFADLQHVEPAGPAYVWDGYIPVGVVTLLGAHGGVGKSTLALMLAVCTALGLPLFGTATRRSNVLFFSGEDPAETVRYRLRKICIFLNVSVADLQGRLHILDATGGNPVLYQEIGGAARGTGCITSTYTALSEYTEQHAIGLLIIDNASDAYDASEIDRAKVRTFMRSLVLLAQARAAGVLLLAHVDKSTARGLSSGSDAYSGSTAWHNSARSRLFLSRDKDGSLLLEHQKHNLGKMREPLRLIWPEGQMPQADVEQTGIVKHIKDGTDTKAVLKLIYEFTERGEYISTAETSRTHAGKLLIGQAGYPARLNEKQLFALLREAHRRGLVERNVYRNTSRHHAERWLVTQAGLDLAGIAATAATAATHDSRALAADAAGAAATAATSPPGGVGDCARAEVAANARVAPQQGIEP